jgi:hypothetical protein
MARKDSYGKKMVEMGVKAVTSRETNIPETQSEP